MSNKTQSQKLREYKVLEMKEKSRKIIDILRQETVGDALKILESTMKFVNSKASQKAAQEKMRELDLNIE